MTACRSVCRMSEDALGQRADEARRAASSPAAPLIAAPDSLVRQRGRDSSPGLFRFAHKAFACSGPFLGATCPASPLSRSGLPTRCTRPRPLSEASLSIPSSRSACAPKKDLAPLPPIQTTAPSLTTHLQGGESDPGQVVSQEYKD